ncbi:MAG: sulfotransferase [Anaerolineales bacterium]
MQYDPWIISWVGMGVLMGIKGKQLNKLVNRYLIIGGAPKSATTSLFRYLSDHPQVCPANRKETYFFARKFDFGGICNSGETAQDFERYFSHCPLSGCMRIEATPYTLYSEQAAEKISDLLPDTRILFILRDPVDRLISDYYFHLQRDHPFARDTFEEFLDAQRKMNSGLPNLIELGCYRQYLQPFIDIFGQSRVFVMFFEEFKRDPSTEMLNLCSAVGLNPEFYSDYNFEAYNKTINIRNSWLNKTSIHMERYVARARAQLMHHPKAYRWFEKMVTVGKRAYWRLNNQGGQKETPIDPLIREELIHYYQPCNQALSKELERALPWQSFRQG